MRSESGIGRRPDSLYGDVRRAHARQPTCFLQLVCVATSCSMAFWNLASFSSRARCTCIICVSGPVVNSVSAIERCRGRKLPKPPIPYYERPQQQQGR